MSLSFDRDLDLPVGLAEIHSRPRLARREISCLSEHRDMYGSRGLCVVRANLATEILGNAGYSAEYLG